MKNGGDHFLAEVASREFMDNLVSILKMPTLNNDVKTAILRYIQNWAIAFEGKAALSYVGTIYKQLQNEGTWPSQCIGSTPVLTDMRLCRLCLSSEGSSAGNHGDGRYPDSARVDRLRRLPEVSDAIHLHQPQASL